MKIIKFFAIFLNFSLAVSKYEFVRKKFSPFKMLGEKYFQRDERDRLCEEDNDEEIAEIFSRMNLDIPFSFYESINFK